MITRGDPLSSRKGRVPRGLFINAPKANCSIYESGQMMYGCLIRSKRFSLDYVELTEHSPDIPNSYDFYAFNYHHVRMSWLDTSSLQKLPGLKLTFVLETLPNNPFVLCPPNDFDVYCTLDPTMSVSDPRVYAFPRPLESSPIQRKHRPHPVPIIGTFGFATFGKGFEKVVEATNKEFDKAVVRINIPPSDFAYRPRWGAGMQNYAEYLGDLCRKTAKPGIEVAITSQFMSKPQLISWCADNTLNCFLYDRNQPGLSATTDQAIASGRPLAVSTNETFRHIHQFVTPYPVRSLRESIATSVDEVKKMQKEWAPAKFAATFELVLDGQGMFRSGAHHSLQPEYIHLARKQLRVTLTGRALRVGRKFRERTLDLVENLRPAPKRTTLCKFLLSRSEIRACTSYLRSNGYISHRLPCKDWDLANILRDIADGDLLDMGSSDSYLLENAVRKGIAGDKYGVDLQRSDASVNGVKYVIGDLTRTGLPDGKFRNITCLSVLEHDVDYAGFAQEASRLLSFGGKLYVTFDYWNPRVVPKLQIFRSPWRILDRGDVERLVSVCQSRGLQLADTIDWTVKKPVITGRYYSPDPSAEYTFGMLVFLKRTSS